VESIGRASFEKCPKLGITIYQQTYSTILKTNNKVFNECPGKVTYVKSRTLNSDDIRKVG
jgi:hypothetical protein